MSETDTGSDTAISTSTDTQTATDDRPKTKYKRIPKGESSLDKRARRADQYLKNLDEGFHYSVLEYADIDGDNKPVEVVWNHERDPLLDSGTDPFTNPDKSRRHRNLAIEHQRNY